MEHINEDRFITALEKSVVTLNNLAETLRMAVVVLEEQQKKIEGLEIALMEANGEVPMDRREGKPSEDYVEEKRR